MRYTTLGSSGAVVSTQALGTMTFGSSTPEEEAREQLETYMDAGGTMIETADIYNDGAAETIVGEWLSHLQPRDRARMFLATKGRFPVGVDPRDAGLSRRHLRRALDASLQRLSIDHVDLYQLHAWDPLTPLEESLGFLEDAVAAGKVTYAGLSNFTGWQIAAAASLARGRFPLVSMQPQYTCWCGKSSGRSARLPVQRPRSTPLVTARRRMAHRQVRGQRHPAGSDQTRRQPQ